MKAVAGMDPTSASVFDTDVSVQSNGESSRHIWQSASSGSSTIDTEKQHTSRGGLQMLPWSKSKGYLYLDDTWIVMFTLKAPR